MSRRIALAAALASLVMTTGLVMTAAPATAMVAQQSATDGQRSLTVSQTNDLDPNGHVVEVTGSGYDTFKGIYVAFCLLPPPNQAPSPCGGGVDMSGVSGASHWISSNPPPYGVGVAEPYAPGGSFTVTLALSRTISDTIDCRNVQCAVVTRNDHQRSTDRSQDLFVPVLFAAPTSDPPPEPTAQVTEPTTTLAAEPPPTEPSTTTAPTTTTEVPAATVTDDEALAATQPKSGGSSTVPIVAGVVAAVLAIAVVGIGLRRRRNTP